ncbi:MAG: redox-regulated ATPase YchF [bacterium]|nr:redox-regulated ATPase YchF [bacterium]
MKIGLFGFPLTGKSTMFQLLTGIEPAPPGGRNESHVGITKVPDLRLDKLSAMYSPKKTTPATVEYLDLAGMEKGEASKVLPLDQLRTADALAHVVRQFGGDIPHSEGAVDPARDVAAMETEFILADQIVAEKRVEKLALQVRKTNTAEDKKELELFQKVLQQLEQETPLRNVEFEEHERRMLRGYTFLSLKPLLVVVNADEADASKCKEGAAAFGLEEIAAHPSTEVVALSAKIEAEISQLDADDAAVFMEELGLERPALERMIQASYSLLGSISFFTVGEDECRAWTIRRGTVAQKAAGSIHSDIERGFIRAELVAYDDLMQAGTWAASRDKGTLRLEGKEYVMADGDVVNFRFNV